MNARTFRALRSASGISQLALAELASCSPTAIAEFETGKRDIRVSTLDRLLDALGVVARYSADGVMITEDASSRTPRDEHVGIGQ